MKNFILAIKQRDKETRDTIRREHPDWSTSEVINGVMQRMHDLPDSDKRAYMIMEDRVKGDVLKRDIIRVRDPKLFKSCINSRGERVHFLQGVTLNDGYDNSKNRLVESPEKGNTDSKSRVDSCQVNSSPSCTAVRPSNTRNSKSFVCV